MSSTSSTARSDARVRHVLLLAVLLLAGLASLHLIFSGLAHWAEIRAGHYLWWKEEWLQLFVEDNYRGRGSETILLTGASEAREGFLTEVLEEAFPERRPYQSSLSMGTMDGLLLLLEYLERAYGADAMPRSIVVGMTPRFVFDYPAVERTPIVTAIDRYSPYFEVAVDAHGAHLESKDLIDSLAARLHFLGKQGRRYRNAVRALLLTAGGPASLEVPLRPPKYHHLPPEPKEGYASHFAQDRAAWSVDESQAVIRADAERLQRICRRHGIDLYVVALPRGPWMDLHHPPGFHDAYAALLGDAYGDHFIDLTYLLEGDEFFDHTHPTRSGAERITARLIETMQREGGGR